MPDSTIVQETSELTAKFYQYGQSSEGFFALAQWKE